MTNLNVVSLIGWLTRDAELKHTSSGTAVCKFSIANNYRTKKNGTWEEETNFFDLVLWGKSAESLSKYLVKGKAIGVKGELRQNRWSDAEGNKKSKIEIIVESLELLGGKVQQSSNAGQFNDNIPF
jgi:single-strand DNA-binding protein